MQTNLEEFSGGFDFIGDIHGCYQGLCELLKKLDYAQQDGCYRYQGSSPRKVIFLGDIVDRGPQVREVVQCVHQMVEAGEAHMLMGNHEFHAIAYYLPRLDKPGEFIRSHSPHHQRLLTATLDAFEDYPDEWEYYREWLLQRPIFIEHPQFRAVHACWDQGLIDQYVNKFKRNSVDIDFVNRFYDKDDKFAYNFLERLMRGIELEMPAGRFITGTDGKKRNNFRARFWLKNPQTYGEIIFRPHMLPDDMHDEKLDPKQLDDLVYYGPQERPLFLGHYWQTGKPKPLTKNIACVDYSAVRKGQLMAYRFNGESTLSADNFVAVDVND